MRDSANEHLAVLFEIMQKDRETQMKDLVV